MLLGPLNGTKIVEIGERTGNLFLIRNKLVLYIFRQTDADEYPFVHI
jgi:hypothetical protein